MENSYKWGSSGFDLGFVTYSYLPKITNNDAKVMHFAAFKANFLSFKFNEIYFLEFRTKDYIDTTLDINYFNQFITNVPYKNFLDFVIDGTLNWDNHNDHLISRLNSAC